MKTTGRSMLFVRLIMMACMISVCFTAAAQSGVERDIPALTPQTSNQLNISLSLVNAKRRNTVRPGRPVSLQVTFSNTGSQRMQVLYSRVYRAGNIVIVDKAGKRIEPHIKVLSQYHLLEDDWHDLVPGGEMRVTLEGEIEHKEEKAEKERKLIFDEIEFVLPGSGEYTFFFVLRQEEPSRTPVSPRDEWTGCAVSNAVKINIR